MESFNYINDNYISPPIIVGVRTEAVLMHTKDGRYFFVEYPISFPPSPSDLFNVNNITSELSSYEFGALSSAFVEYEYLQTKMGAIHAPTYLHGFTKAKGLDLGELNILL